MLSSLSVEMNSAVASFHEDNRPGLAGWLSVVRRQLAEIREFVTAAVPVEGFAILAKEQNIDIQALAIARVVPPAARGCAVADGGLVVLYSVTGRTTSPS